MPRKIVCNSIFNKESIVLEMSEEVKLELYDATNCLADLGVTPETFESSQHSIAVRDKLTKTIQLANAARNMLLNTSGACLIRGFYDDLYKDNFGLSETIRRYKLAYYLFNMCIGEVDSGSRGPLFDVKDTGLSPEEDNILFSVTNAEATWHTDGASIDKVKPIKTQIKQNKNKLYWKLRRSL